MDKNLKIIKEQEILGKQFAMYGTVESPLFLAKDVAEWIEYAYKDNRQINRDVSKMLGMVDEDEKLKSTIKLGGEDCSHGGIRGNTEMWFLTENGLYEVLMQSRKSIAKQFKTEVKRILKQMRLTGGAVIENREAEFITNYFPSFSEEVKLAMVLDLRNQNEQYKLKLEEQKPLVEFADHVSNASNLIDIGRLAKLVNDEHIPIGRNKLFDWLRSNKYLRNNNEPYQQYIDNGVFKVKEYTYTTPYGDKVGTKVYVTGKGQIYIVEKLRKLYTA